MAITWGLRARDADEDSRASSPLELLTDLCFVVAVAQASTKLHHAAAENHLGFGVLHFALVFFAIWWAWVNFAWFASAYDDDGILYRLLTIGQILGVLTLAAGVPRAFDGDFRLVVVGYVVMRVALVVQWLRAASGDAEHRTTCLRYAGGIAVVQVLWVGFLALSGDVQIEAFGLLVVAELFVPVWAERTGMTTWHPEHIADRYSAFFIIVLGEEVLSVTIAIQDAIDEREVGGGLVWVVSGGILIVFSLWWLYFSRDASVPLSRLRGSGIEYVWGFGHYFVFGGAAAVGAGLASRVDYWDHAHEATGIATGLLVTGSVAVVLTAFWVVRVAPESLAVRDLVPTVVAVAAVLAVTPTATPEVWAGVICAALLVHKLVVIGGSGHVGAAAPPA